MAPAPYSVAKERCFASGRALAAAATIDTPIRPISVTTSVAFKVRLLLIRLSLPFMVRDNRGTRGDARPMPAVTGQPGCEGEVTIW